MQKQFLFSLFLCNIITSFGASTNQQATLQLIKQRWITWADNQVNAEKIKFLASYGLTIDDLNNDEAIQGLRSTHDEMVETDLIAHSSEQGYSNDIQTITAVAQRLFHNYNVKIINNSTFSFGQICVSHHYKTNCCYVTLNASEHAKNPQGIEQILRHELSHIIHEDNFHKELIQCLAWVNSHDEHEQVEEKSWPFCRAYETRADIYALCNATDNGECYIATLKLVVKDSAYEPETHPAPAQRIALLEQIKAELDAAAKAN